LIPKLSSLEGEFFKNGNEFINDIKQASFHDMGIYQRKVPIYKINDKTIDLAPVALAIYEKEEQNSN